MIFTVDANEDWWFTYGSTNFIGKVTEPTALVLANNPPARCIAGRSSKWLKDPRTGVDTMAYLIFVGEGEDTVWLPLFPKTPMVVPVEVDGICVNDAKARAVLGANPTQEAVNHYVEQAKAAHEAWLQENEKRKEAERAELERLAKLAINTPAPKRK